MTSCPSPRRSQSGTALVVVVTATIPLLAAAGTLLMVCVRQRTQVEESYVVAAARDTASAGAQDAIAKLEADPNYTGTYDLAIDGHSAHVVVTDWSSDKLDNDGNGKVDDAGEAGYVGIVSDGRVNCAFAANGVEVATAARSERRTASAVVKRSKLDVVVNTAFYVEDPLADFTFNGTAFQINGNDTNLDNTPGPNPAIPGIGTDGNPSGILAQLSKSQKPCVVGKGGAPSVSTVAPTDVCAEIGQLGALATTTWGAGATSLDNAALGDRAKMKAVVAHAKGDLKLSGSTTGCGILVVDGNLTVTGNFDYAGLILVMGSVTFKGGGGNKDLHGALFTPGSVVGEDVDLSGTIQIRYSSQALTTVTSQVSSGVQLVSWAQR